jgi:hypothetical protein
MSSSNPIRSLLSALFQAGSKTILREEETSWLGKVDSSPVQPEDVYLGPTPWLDPNTNEPWEPPSLSD